MNESIDTETDLSDSIPPPPPPVSLNKKQQLKMLQQDCLKGFTDNALELQSMLDDCTTTILNCANNVADHFINTSSNSTTTESTESSSSAVPVTTILHGSENKPDLCRHDEMTIHSHKLKSKSPALLSSVPMTSSNYFNQSLLSQQNFDNQLPTRNHQIGKYNTIGPSNIHNFQFNRHQIQQQQSQKQSHLQRHHSPQMVHPQQHQRQQQQQNLEPPPCNNLTNARRYFSQSLTNFPFNYGTLLGKDKQQQNQQHQQKKGKITKG